MTTTALIRLLKKAQREYVWGIERSDFSLEQTKRILKKQLEREVENASTDGEHVSIDDRLQMQLGYYRRVCACVDRVAHHQRIKCYLEECPENVQLDDAVQGHVDPRRIRRGSYRGK